jgi:RimJ/RimL family protein N-acetyltransferase
VADLGPVDWPPEPIHTDRVVLRQTEGGDRATFIDLHASAEVCRYVGGPRARAELEDAVPQIPGNRPGVFAVEREGVVIGTVSFARRDLERPGHVRPNGGEIELGYLFLPAAWGFGYAAEASRAALDWVARALPGEPVVLCTQSANTASVRLARTLGFVEVERFEEFGAEQWFGSSAHSNNEALPTQLHASS